MRHALEVGSIPGRSSEIRIMVKQGGQSPSHHANTPLSETSRVKPPPCRHVPDSSIQSYITGTCNSKRNERRCSTTLPQAWNDLIEMTAPRTRPHADITGQLRTEQVVIRCCWLELKVTAQNSRRATLCRSKETYEKIDSHQWTTIPMRSDLPI